MFCEIIPHFAGKLQVDNNIYPHSHMPAYFDFMKFLIHPSELRNFILYLNLIAERFGPDFLRDHLSGHINGANIRKKLSINRSLEDLAWNCSNVYGSQCVISSSYVREYSVTVGFA